MDDSFLARLKAGTKNQKTIKWPGTKQDIVLRVLSEGQYQQARIDAEKYFKGQGVEINFALADAFESEESTQVLYLALRTPDNQPLAASMNEFRELIVGPEKNALAQEYMDLEAECSPDPDKMAQEEFDDLVENVKKKPEEIAGSISSLSTARRLIIALASPPATSPTDNGSISTP